MKRLEYANQLILFILGNTTNVFANKYIKKVFTLANINCFCHATVKFIKAETVHYF